MSDLETLRDHARARAASAHRMDCQRATSRYCDDMGSHEARFMPLLGWWCPGRCGGCQSDRERAMWRAIAEDIERFLGAEYDDDNGQDTLL